MLAVAATTVVVLSLTLFAFQTKWDFTMMGGVLFVALMLFIMVGLILSFTQLGKSSTGSLIFSSIGALLFSVYLIRKYIFH